MDPLRSVLVTVLMTSCSGGGNNGAAVGSGSPASPASPARTDAPAAAELAIEFHAQRVGVIYDEAKLAEAIAARGGAVALQLGAGDVERYVVGPFPSDMVALQLTSAASRRWRDAAVAAETTPFVVRVGGERLYAGVVYNPIGAAGIDTPVVHVRTDGDAVTLFVGARQGLAYAGSASPEAGKRIDRPEMRAAFAARGALVEQPRAPRLK